MNGPAEGRGQESRADAVLAKFCPTHFGKGVIRGQRTQYTKST